MDQAGYWCRKTVTILGSEQLRLANSHEMDLRRQYQLKVLLTGSTATIEAETVLVLDAGRERGGQGQRP